jgi:glutamyl-Q tRNA(Asp) synthetase
MPFNPFGQAAPILAHSPVSASRALTMSKYVGRFAPSPTGALHFGSLVAAVASYCDAKVHNGRWLLRIEDVDTTRTVKGAAQAILAVLDAYGFAWDEQVVYQSQRSANYQRFLDQLIAQGLAYPCTCSRKEIADSSTRTGIDGKIYPGTCRIGCANAERPQAWRIRTEDVNIGFHDRALGYCEHAMAREIGDFVLKRADGLFAYQLAVVVDDFEQGVTDVVRGADLLNSTTRQIYLQQTLGLPTPRYLHIPVVTNAAGEKLSKQTLAQPLRLDAAKIELFNALSFLGLQPPSLIKNATLDEMWRWAFEHWADTRLGLI